MARFYFPFFGIILCTGYGCTTPPVRLLVNTPGPYDPFLVQAANRLAITPRAHNLICALEESFAEAQHADLNEIDSLKRTQSAGEHSADIHVRYKRMQERQQLVKSLLPLKSRRGYVPRFSFIREIMFLEQESKREAVDYLYEGAVTALQNADEYHSHVAAREAAAQLDHIKKYYYPHWRQMDTLRNKADSLGRVFVLLRAYVPKARLFSPGFEENFSWTTIHTVPRPGHLYDYQAQYSSPEVSVRPESFSTSTRTETTQVECGQKVERDTAGRIIKQEKIYCPRTTTIYTCTTNRSATGHTSLSVRRAYPLDTIEVLDVEETYLYSESVTHENTEKCNPAPANQVMEDRVERQMRAAILHKIREIVRREYP